MIPKYIVRNLLLGLLMVAVFVLLWGVWKVLEWVF